MSLLGTKISQVSNTPQHYFTAEPASAADRRTMVVHLAGQDHEVETAAGVFSPGRVDLGTSVLLNHVPKPPQIGNVLDLGCGWGPVALTLALQAPGTTVWAVDVNERALDLLRRNASRLELENVKAVRPVDVPADVRFAALWSNPPIRVGKTVLHDMLSHWLPRLEPEAEAHLVVQRNLGADSLQAWIKTYIEAVQTVDRIASAKGFRVLRVAR